MSSPQPTIPATMRALVCPDVGQPLTLTTVPTPTVVAGSVLVKVLASTIDSHLPHILSGASGFTFPKNNVPGSTAIGRVVATGQDSTTLRVGALVLLEPWVRARDDPDVQILWGIYDGPSPASKKFMRDNWAMAGYAEYCLAPLENAHVLDEERLCGKFGYGHADLLQLAIQLVSYGGWRAIGLQAGERVIVAPATGSFSGAAVHVAVAMGATVIAMGRNRKVLEELQGVYGEDRVKIVENTGDVDGDTAELKKFGPVDAYMDISPFQAGSSTHIASCFKAVKQSGRIVLEGVVPNDIAVPYVHAVMNNLTIKGQYMYERSDAKALIKLAESGVLKLGKDAGMEVLGQFGMEDIEKAIEVAAANPGAGKFAALKP